MYRDALPESSLFTILTALDRQTAAEVGRGACPFCGGTLHRGDYPRKPRGGPTDPAYRRRYSFCCAEPGCRRRTTPPSVRFLGRKVYLAVVVLLCGCVLQGPAPARVARLAQQTGISPRTLRRWLRWWRRHFVLHDAWRASQGLLHPPVDETRLPHSLLARFSPRPDPRVSLLQFLAPWTTRSHAF